ncbi:hypothetical protein ACKI10_46315, partial [Streptomyces galilaeus]|uniref:hypothetical protein n=1 Tax=Streptomyces galilaeus TaxID=33899 RepID=UPI0038F7C4D6
MKRLEDRHEQQQNAPFEKACSCNIESKVHDKLGADGHCQWQPGHFYFFEADRNKNEDKQIEEICKHENGRDGALLKSSRLAGPPHTL